MPSSDTSTTSSTKSSTNQEQVATSVSSSTTPKNSIAQVIILLLLGWAFLYNVVIKQQPISTAFFTLIDTITEDLVMGSLLTIFVGLGIAVVFTCTKLYTQIISRPSSFAVLERIFLSSSLRDIVRRILHFDAEFTEDNTENNGEVVPQRISSVCIILSAVYAVSWVYILLFSEAIGMLGTIAGVDMVMTTENIHFLPMLALSIPFAGRVMAYVRYPYTEDYANFMPIVVFLLLLVWVLGYVFPTGTTEVFLLQIWYKEDLFREFLRSGLNLAFIPVFSEALFWMMQIFATEKE